jgi:Transmembrane secretion effector
VQPRRRDPSPRWADAGIRSLRLLWAGQGVSLLGDQITLLALPLLALAMGASVGHVAALAVAGRAPFLVLTLPAGVWVRRLGLRRSMLAADVLRSAALASVPLAAVLGGLGYAQLVVVSLLLGTGATLFQVAYQSLTPLLTTNPRRLRRANGVMTGMEAVALTGGPALAGALVALLGAARAVWGDAASYVVSALTLARMRVPGDVPVQPRSTLRREVAGGIRYVLTEPVLRAILWSSVLYNLGAAGYEALLVVFAVGDLGLSPAMLGVVVGLGGLGVPLGILASGPVERALGVGPVLLLSGTLSGTGVVVATLACGATATYVLAGGTFVTALGGGAWGLTALTARQTLSQPQMRSMTTAVHRWATYGAYPLGAALAGALAVSMSTTVAIRIVAVVAQLAALPLLSRPVRRTRALVPPPKPLRACG